MQVGVWLVHGCVVGGLAADWKPHTNQSARWPQPEGTSGDPGGGWEFLWGGWILLLNPLATYITFFLSRDIPASEYSDKNEQWF